MTDRTNSASATALHSSGHHDGNGSTEKHARHYRDVAWEADTLYKQKENVMRGLQLFDRERAHLEAAFYWLQGRRNKESAALLTSLVDQNLRTGQRTDRCPT